MANKIINESGYSQYNFNYEKTDLFQDLKKLFSTDVIIRDQGNGELKVIDINQIQSNGILQSNSLIDRFSKIYTTSGLGVYNSFNNYNFQALRAQLYLDYDAMDTDAIIHSALDIYADESVLKNEKNKNIKIISTNEEIKKELENLYYNIINVNFNLWFWIRNLVKYGDFFLKLELLERFGVYNVIPFTPYGIVREEGYDRRRPNAIRFKFDPTHIQGASSGFGIAAPYPYASNRSIYFENYEMVHLRLQGDINYLPYGTSILENGRKLFKQYVLIEDAALIHRIARSPEKRIYYINVGAIPPEEVDAYIQKMISNIKRTPLVDPKTGDYNLKYNMMNMLDDFFVPVRGNDVTTKIDTIKGLDYAGMEDIAYFREKLFAALKVPKAFMGYEKDLCIAPDTKIPLLDGRILTANEIIDEFNKGIKNYVYSIDETTKDIVPGEIEWAGFTRMNTKTIKVWLDNNQYIQCTPDHLFLTREGEWIEAQNLKEGQSLMPLYLKKSIFKKIINFILKGKTKYKVLKIEEVEELIDTCDLTIKDYHNFGTEAGVIIHNSGKSTLAAQDIRFARTIERIQAIVLSELKKIGLVHLYIKGFKTEELGNFDLSLTLPSIIYEQEQIALLKEKMELAKNMVADNYFSTDYIYENIFKMTQHEYFSMRDEIKEDLKRTFNNSQIKSEGNDNETSGQIFGTPHRLAKLYQQNADGSEAKKIPPGYGEKELNTYPLPGRPVSNTTILRTDDDPLTRDRLGRKDIEDTLNVRNDLDPKHNYKGKKVLSLEENIKPLNQQEIFLIEDLKYKTGKVGIIKESKQNKKVSYPKIKSILAESLDFDENREKVLTQQEINDIKNEGINILVESQQYNMEDNSDNILSKYEQKIFKD